MRVSCTVNGEPRQADDVWEGESLLYVLRERLGLPGSKNACEQGECGSCSVYLDGVLVCACLVLAGQAEGSEITTVEGLAADDTLHPVQEAFVEAGAVQCGICTPGLVVATHDLLARNPSPTDPEIREALAGNLCRCTGYEKVLAAVRLAVGRLAAGDPAAGGPGGGVWTAPGTPSDPGLPSHSGAPGTRGRDDARPRALEAVKVWGAGAEQAGAPEEPGVPEEPGA
jgi:carbon-monoxide dehydrogenase small subunit